jgi:glucokinase
MKQLFIDCGGTYLRSELVTDEGSQSQTLPSASLRLWAFIEEQMAQHPDISFIGVAYAGQVEEGVILASPNIAQEGQFPIAQKAKTRYGVELRIDNDLQCALLAEAAYWKCDTCALLFVGTGLGAAVMDHGHVVRGSRNMAFELGHIPYHVTPWVCGCGRSNCLELSVSGSGIDKALHYYEKEASLSLEHLRNSHDPKERAIAHTFEEGLLCAVGTLVTLSNPSVVVLGGGVIDHNPYLVEWVRKNLHDYALKPTLESLRIEHSVLTNAPLEGAKLLSREKR